MTQALRQIWRFFQGPPGSGSAAGLADLAIAQRNEALEHNRRLEELLNSAIEQRNQAYQERDAARAELLKAGEKTAEDRRLVREIFHELSSSKEKRLDAGATALVVITAASQVAQLELLLENTFVLKTWYPVVVSYLDPRQAQLCRLREKHGLPVFAHEQVYAQGLVRGSYRSTGRVSAANRYDFWTSLALDETVNWDRIVDEIRYQTGLRNGFLRSLAQTSASLLILFEDNAESDTGIWIDAANVLGIASVIVPFTIADAVEPAESHWPDRLFHVSTSKYNEMAAEHFPHWTLLHKEARLIRRPGVSALAAEWLGLAPPDPWILNSSFASAIAVESDAMMQHYRRLGVAAEKLVKTGSLSDDILYANQVRADARPTILCAFPPNQLSVRPDLEFADYSALAEFWIACLKRTGWRVIIRPHPAIPDTDLDILRSHGAEISTAHTAALIPQCDLFVACVSSTIRWALAMGKPVLNYDVFRYAYRDFDDAPAVVTVIDKTGFAESLARFTSGGLSQLTAAAERDAPRWGEIDGRSGKRILALFDRLRANATE